MRTTLPPLSLGAILLAEGWASLGTEILALRRMVPWAGSSVDVTSVLIAVYLAALAGGYRRGGRLAGRGDPRPRLALRLAAAAAWAAFWLSEPGVLLAFGTASGVHWRRRLSIRSSASRRSAGCWPRAYCWLTPAHPPATPPKRPEESFLSPPSATWLAHSPRHSCCMPTLGVSLRRRSAVVAAPRRRRLSWHHAATCRSWRCSLACCWPALDLWVEATEYVERNAYCRLSTSSSIDDGRQGCWSSTTSSLRGRTPKDRGFNYAELLERTLCGAGRDAYVLVLGAAGMTVGRGAPCELEITFVDIDPAQESDRRAIPRGPRRQKPGTSSGQ